MGDLEILKRYVQIGDMTDLRYMATEFALEHDYECLEIVIDEIEMRTRADKAIMKTEMGRFQKKENEGLEDKPKTIKREKDILRGGKIDLTIKSNAL